MTVLLLARGLGFVSGLRTFTPVAAVLLVRGGIWGIVLAVAAVGEYVWDVLPNTQLETILILSALRPVTTMIVLRWRFHLRGSSPGFKYSRPSGPMAVTWVTYSPDFAQWKWDVLPGRTITLPGGYASTLSPSN